MKRDQVPDPRNNPFKVRSGGAPAPTRSYQPSYSPPSGKKGVDFENERVCPSCAKIIALNYNFCKYCGVDLSEIEPIGKADEISKQLAITAMTDPDFSVRKEALDTLGSFKEKRILGLLAYLLVNDPSPEVRKEAADELGDLHHPYSLNILTQALKDASPIVRKEAIEGLKKIKQKNKPEKQLEEPEEKEATPELEEIEVEKEPKSPLDDFGEFESFDSDM